MIERYQQLRALPGRAYGIRQPVVLGELRIGLQTELDFAKLDEAMGQLIAAVTGGQPRPFQPSRELSQPESLLALRSLHWTVVLQHGAGLPLFEPGGLLRQRQLEDAVQLAIVMPYVNSQAALMSLDAVLSALNAMLTAVDDEQWQNAQQQQQTALQQCVQSLRKLAPPGGNTLRFLHAAHQQRIFWRHVAGNIYEFGHGVRMRWLDSSFTDRTSNLGSKLARHKNLAATALRSAGLPVPPHVRVESAEQAENAAEQMGYPVVVKPMDQDGGIAVSAGLRDAEGVRKAYELVKKHSENVLLEKHVPGRDYRLIVLNGKLIWAILRVPGGVVGDGQRNVGTLIDTLNADPRRGGLAGSPLKTLDCDEEVLDLLTEAGLTLESVPEAGKFVRLRRAANVATGGVPVGVLEKVHPDNALLAVRAAAALRLDFAGIDLLIPDIAKSWLETGAAICEVNAQPQLGVVTAAHLYGEILKDLVKNQGRIPIVLIVGDALAELTAASLKQRWQEQGLCVGRASSAGAWLDGTRIFPAAKGYFAAAQTVLTSPTVEAAVIVARSTEILQQGLPLEACDVVVLAGNTRESDAAVLNVKPEARMRFAQMCGMVLPHVRGSLVINASDPLCLAQKDALPDRTLVASGGNPEELVATVLDTLTEKAMAANGKSGSLA